MKYMKKYENIDFEDFDIEEEDYNDIVYYIINYSDIYYIAKKEKTMFRVSGQSYSDFQYSVLFKTPSGDFISNGYTIKRYTIYLIKSINKKKILSGEKKVSFVSGVSGINRVDLVSFCNDENINIDEIRFV